MQNQSLKDIAESDITSSDHDPNSLISLTHHCSEYIPCISAVEYSNVLGEGHGTGVLTNYTINTWSDCHQ